SRNAGGLRVFHRRPHRHSLFAARPDERRQSRVERLRQGRRRYRCAEVDDQYDYLCLESLTEPAMNPEIEKELAALGDLHRRMLAEFAKVIVGQRDVLDELLITVFSGGHNLLEGVPGLAKTLMISTVSRLLPLAVEA